MQINLSVVTQISGLQSTRLTGDQNIVVTAYKYILIHNHYFLLSKPNKKLLNFPYGILDMLSDSFNQFLETFFPKVPPSHNTMK